LHVADHPVHFHLLLLCEQSLQKYDQFLQHPNVDICTSIDEQPGVKLVSCLFIPHRNNGNALVLAFKTRAELKSIPLKF
jgi:hypothetical protein